jgi:hypothetical protein
MDKTKFIEEPSQQLDMKYADTEAGNRARFGSMKLGNLKIGKLTMRRVIKKPV